MLYFTVAISAIGILITGLTVEGIRSLALLVCAGDRGQEFLANAATRVFFYCSIWDKRPVTSFYWLSGLATRKERIYQPLLLVSAGHALPQPQETRRMTALPEGLMVVSHIIGGDLRGILLISERS